jgi:hypothetical protein
VTTTSPSQSVSTPASGPGAQCACGCPGTVPDGAQRNTRFLPGHRQLSWKRRQDAATPEGQAAVFWDRVGGRRRGDAFGHRRRRA